MTDSNLENPVVQNQAAPVQDARTSNFLRDQIAEDIRTNKFGDAVV